MLLLFDRGLFRYDGLNCRYVFGSPNIKRLISPIGHPSLALTANLVLEITPAADSLWLIPRLPCQDPIQALVDRNAVLWVAQKNGEVLRLQQDHTTLFSLPELPDTCFMMELEGTVWIIGKQRYWYYFDPDTGQFKSVTSPLNGTAIRDCQKKDEHAVWVVTDSGLFAVNVSPRGASWDRLILTGSDIQSIAADGEKRLYIGTHGRGLLKLDINRDKIKVEPMLFSNTVQNIEMLPSRHIFSLYIDRDHSIWAHTEQGLAHLHAKSFLSFYEKKPMDDWVFVQQSKDSVYYYNTWSTQGAIFRLDPRQSAQPAIVLNSGTASIYSMTTDEQDVWAGNAEGKIFRVHRDRPGGTIDLSKRGGAVFQVYADRKHRIWFAQAPGGRPLPGTSYTDASLKVYYFGPEAGLPNRILCFHEDASGNLFAGGVGPDTYLFRFDEQKHCFINLSQTLPMDGTNLEAHDIVSDSSGILWIGTTNGLLRYNWKDQTLERVDLGEHMITGTEIRALALDRYSQLWIGTDVYGLLCHTNQQTIRYQLSDGVLSKGIFYRSIIIDRTGRIWVGTDVGYSFSRVTAARLSQTVPPTLYKLRINDVPQQLQPDHLFQAPYKAEIGIDFHSLSYPANHLHYQWRIRALDEHWSEETTKGHLSLSKLEHGRYEVEIRARQSGQAWSEPLVLTFHIRQVWYLQGWAFVCYWVIFFSCVLGLAHLNNRRLYLKNARLQKIISANTKELQIKNEEISQQNEALKQQYDYISRQAEKLEISNTLKARLFSIISHDLRGPFGAIKGVLSLASKGLIAEQEFKNIAPQLLKELEGTSLLLDNLLFWAKNQMEGVVLNAHPVDLAVVTTQQMDLFSLSTQNKAILLTSEIQPDTMVVADAQVLGIILRNLIANAVKFCRPGDRIAIRAEKTNDRLQIAVEDTGIGMSETTLTGLFQINTTVQRGTQGEYGTGLGLMVCKEYLEKMGGTLRVESTEGKGSIFYCDIPV